MDQNRSGALVTAEPEVAARISELILNPSGGGRQFN
jgi:hypothetical protein